VIGTNVVAIATPHGSIATILVRASGSQRGVSTPSAAYLAGAWRYAVVGAAGAFTALVLVAH